MSSDCPIPKTRSKDGSATSSADVLLRKPQGGAIFGMSVKSIKTGKVKAKRTVTVLKVNNIKSKAPKAPLEQPSVPLLNNSHSISSLELDEAASPGFKQTKEALIKFINIECIPAEKIYREQQKSLSQQGINAIPQIVKDLQRKARKYRVWNLYLSEEFIGATRFSQYEYCQLFEVLSRSFLGTMATNCDIANTATMYMLAKHFPPTVKDKVLLPLIRGAIYTGVALSEPNVSSSDYTNLKTVIRRDGGSWVVNGQKSWVTNAGHPDCKFVAVFGRRCESDRGGALAFVPLDAPGVKFIGSHSTFGYDDAPEGFYDIQFDNVRVPLDMAISGKNTWAKMQGSLIPGRLHQCIRAIGMAERALDLLIARAAQRKTFGKPLLSQGTILNYIAESRADINLSRMLTYKAAKSFDTFGPFASTMDTSIAKMVVPTATGRVIDKAIQIFGAAGVGNEQPLASMWSKVRCLRITEGPDEVHKLQVARLEIKRFLSEQSCVLPTKPKL
ncbi:hypothetical protein H4219_005059 [Mycoemilia scoparia]|uniref:Uncharacterized protein n=1 Tax=Mycoemilia scoparia TaxID=417184 RepID=A0A9W7ZV45_9FUNG|nr:hypothetical protein H4219_005059 [Mycoemilia scoparia]